MEALERVRLSGRVLNECAAPDATSMKEKSLNTELQADASFLATGKIGWRHRVISYLLIPVCWILAFISFVEIAPFIYFVLLLIYLGLLYTLTFTTMFEEEKFAGRLKFWRKTLSMTGRLALGGFISVIYVVLYVAIVQGPGGFQ